MSNKENSYKLN